MVAGAGRQHVLVKRPIKLFDLSLYDLLLWTNTRYIIDLCDASDATSLQNHGVLSVGIIIGHFTFKKRVANCTIYPVENVAVR